MKMAFNPLRPLKGDFCRSAAATLLRCFAGAAGIQPLSMN